MTSTSRGQQRPTPATRAGRLRRPLGSTMAVLAAATVVLVPTPAGADEVADSNYDVSCTIHPDLGSGGSTDPGGVAFDGERNDVTASHASHAITGSSESVYPAGSRYSGEDCEVTARWEDLLTVGAGSSGLSAGDLVPVQVTVRLAARVDETWDADGFFQTRGRYSVWSSVRSLDGCLAGGEVPRCDTPLSFGSDHEHYVTGGPADPWYYPNGYVEAAAKRSYNLSTNGGTDLSDYVDEYNLVCESWPCAGEVHPPLDPEVFTVPATVTVGYRYQMVGSLNLFTQAYDNVGVRGLAAVDDFSVTVTPAAGFEDVALTYASAAGPTDEDVTAPEVVADVSPAAAGGWHTAAPTIAFSATDADSGVASITYRSTGAVETAETVTEGDAAELVIGTDGVTEVTYQATDGAGNVSEPQTLTVRLDRGAPRLLGVQDVTVVAANGKEAAATWSVTGEDDQGEPVAVTCDPASGAALPVGATEVTCLATDAAGNTASAAFTVTVTVPQPPVLHLPEPIVVDATAPGGASVTYAVTATDDGAVPPTVVCTPPSGGTFPIGARLVTCTATDDTGLVTTGRFEVRVRGAGAQLGELLKEITGINPRGNASVRAILTAVARAVDAVLPVIGCQPLATVAQLLQGPSAKQLPSDTVAGWLADIQRIAAVIGCSSGKAGNPVK